MYHENDMVREGVLVLPVVGFLRSVQIASPSPMPLSF